jgi:hypothetical protein
MHFFIFAEHTINSAEPRSGPFDPEKFEEGGDGGESNVLPGRPMIKLPHKVPFLC